MLWGRGVHRDEAKKVQRGLECHTDQCALSPGEAGTTGGFRGGGEPPPDAGTAMLGEGGRMGWSDSRLCGERSDDGVACSWGGTAGGMTVE